MYRLFAFVGLVLVMGACQSGENSLFRKIDATHSGITFSNDITSTDTMNAFVFTNFYNGSGVGIADFNQDGLPDICFSANQKQPELYLNKGKLQFEKIENTGLRNPGWVTGISIVDINQDGRPDIYFSMARHSSLSSSANQLYINQGTDSPTFVEQAADYGLAFDGFTTQTVFFDYDLDGDLDAYLLNTAPDVSNPNTLRISVNDGTYPSSDKLFRNTGKQADGIYRYEDVSLSAGIRYEGLGLGVALADFNRDGLTDIYCSNDFQSDDALYLNQADGTFRNVLPLAMPHSSMFGMGVDAADFNNDLKTDLFQLDMLPEGSERQKMMIAKGDYEKKQLSISSQYRYHLQYMRNTLQVQQGVVNGIPYFSDQGLMHGVATTDWSWSVLLADFDLDGWKDVFVSNGYRKNITDLDFIRYNQDAFGTDAAKAANSIDMLDKIPEVKLRNYAFKNRPGNAFLDVSKEWGLDALSYSNGAGYADLDLDGDLDLVVNNIDEPAFLYENITETPRFIKISLQGKPDNREGIGASIRICTADTCQLYDYFPVKGYCSSMNVPLIVGLGEHTAADQLEITWPGGKRQTLSNIQSGTSLTLSIDDAQPGSPLDDFTKSAPVFTELTGVLEYLHTPSAFVDFRQTPTLQKMVTRNGPVLESGDFNGDSVTDVIVGGCYQGSPTVVYLRSADAAAPAVPDTLQLHHLTVGAMAVADFNLDGFSDVLVAPGACERPFSAKEAYQPVLFLGGPKGLSPAPPLPDVRICTESALVYDVNGDGRPDVILGGSYIPQQYPEICESILLIAGENGFTLETPDWLPRKVAVKDIIALPEAGSTKTNILLTGHWTGLTLLEKTSDGFLSKTLDWPTGWWNCLSAADLDQDGDLDLVVGNEGLNTLFKASPQQPVSLLAKDFNNDGRMDPIWGLYLDGKEVAVHPLGTLIEQIVQFRKRYTYFKDYSKADLSDLFTKNDLKGAQIYHATELRAGIAWNDGQGNFTFEALPFDAQQAPVNDILIQDFNRDGLADLLLTGNFYPNEPVIGQSDASYGLLLSATGNGNYRVVPMEESGLKITGDARKWLHLPAEKQILVSKNNGAVQGFSY